MGLSKVFAVGAVTLVQVRDRVEADTVYAAIKPEAERIDHRPPDLGVVKVQVWLLAEEPVPIVLAGVVVPGPIGAFRVGEDDPGVRVLVVRVRPDVIVAIWRVL